jgi:hypothetical protein
MTWKRAPIRWEGSYWDILKKTGFNHSKNHSINHIYPLFPIKKQLISSLSIGNPSVMFIGPDGVPVPCPAALAASESAVGA